jgi:hypothetical protein
MGKKQPVEFELLRRDRIREKAGFSGDLLGRPADTNRGVLCNRNALLEQSP